MKKKKIKLEKILKERQYADQRSLAQKKCKVVWKVYKKIQAQKYGHTWIVLI